MIPVNGVVCLTIDEFNEAIKYIHKHNETRSDRFGESILTFCRSETDEFITVVNERYVDGERVSARISIYKKGESVKLYAEFNHCPSVFSENIVSEHNYVSLAFLKKITRNKPNKDWEMILNDCGAGKETC